MSNVVSDEELLGYVREYLDSQGMDPGEVEVRDDTELSELGLDSISIAELLLSARAGLVETGRISPDATLLELPPVQTVGDLGGLIRTLA
jgi:hypothetical protein